MPEKKQTLRGDRTKFENKKLTPGQQRYLKRQSKDPYVKAAHADGYRSRAAYKLIEINEKHPIFPKKGSTAMVVDLGAAPGGWTQVVQEVMPDTPVLASDILDFEPLEGVTFVKGDFTEDDVLNDILAVLGTDKTPLVMSDMAANTIGHAATDHIRSMVLAEAAAECALELLALGGNFVCKFFQGGDEQKLRDYLRPRFEKVHFYKPPSSRSDSREQFLIALGFKG